MMNKIIDGKLVSKLLKDELKEKISNLSVKPKLVVISVGNDEASKVYVRQKEKASLYVGMEYDHVHYDNIDEESLINKINELNNDDSVSGMIVQLPLPSGLNANRIINSIDPKKDVDGLTYLNQGKLLNKENCLVSCTPNGVMELLKYYKVDLEGKNVVIIGRSNLVGKPLFNLMINANATVTLCHSKTKNIEKITKRADILVVAIGSPNFVNKDMIKKGCIIVDVGINRVNDQLIGDVDYNSCYDKCKLITPVPGGVGPMTVTMLLYNTYNAFINNSK